MSNQSWLTAIRRNRPSAPLNYLLGSSTLSGRILDYGCGRGDDVEYLSSQGYPVDGYDPYHRPAELTGTYDTILCFYVLNVLPEDDRRKVLLSINDLLTPGGVAYIAVRRDIMECHCSLKTSQYFIQLSLPVMYERKGKFCIYRMNKS